MTDFLTIDHLLLVTLCMHSKFQNRCTFPSGRKVMTAEEEEKERRRKKLTCENNGHLSFPVTRFETNTRANFEFSLYFQA